MIGFLWFSIPPHHTSRSLILIKLFANEILVSKVQVCRIITKFAAVGERKAPEMSALSNDEQ